MAWESPSYRASGSDLTIAISPLGLVELADEEFEVHGPRLTRYANNWAFYLGYHWAVRREPGEPQVTLNLVRTMADYHNSFTFGKGLTFRSPKQTEAIVPNALKTVWEDDNDKEAVLQEIGQMGGVSGDCFVKIAWEDPYQDPAGFVRPGRVRIVVLNSSHCFPEWDPHDRSKLIRFKLKYRFWDTSLEGTRHVYTYTEIMTAEWIERYINDELIETVPNLLGVIPVKHCANFPVAGSPWGLSDLDGLIPLNREINEKATAISDIINYYAAPVTVITGARAAGIERSPKKLIAIPSKDAKIQNLEVSHQGVAVSLEYITWLKERMHEIAHIPVSALGQSNPISNTSGVALHIEYLPLMMYYAHKRTQYTKLVTELNDLILRTLFVYDPNRLVYDPGSNAELEPGQVEQLDPRDPISFRTTVHWPPPLPIDVLVKMNEEQVKMALGLQSKRGALRELGEEFPDEKMAEIMDELHKDVVEQGSLDLLRATVQQTVMAMTGMLPDGSGPVVPSAGSGGGSSSSSGSGGPLPGVLPPMPPVDEGLANYLQTAAFGTKMPQRRNPTDDEP